MPEHAINALKAEAPLISSKTCAPNTKSGTLFPMKRKKQPTHNIIFTGYESTREKMGFIVVNRIRSPGPRAPNTQATARPLSKGLGFRI